MSQKKAIVCLGIDQFDTGIAPLSGAANDARSWGGLFEHRMGYTVKVLTHEDLAAGQLVMRSIRELLQPLGAGDLFGLFIASHGKTLNVNGRPEQVFLLPHASRRSLAGGNLGDGVITLSQLQDETAKPGLQRFFIIDACRSPLEIELATSRDGEEAVVFEGEAVYRDLVLRTRRPIGNDASPLTIVNSCPNQQRALELRKQRRGWFSLSAQQPIAARLDAGQDIVLDDEFLAEVESAMARTASADSLQVASQRPSREGAAVKLFSAHGRASIELDRLSREFELRLADGELFEPLGRCANDTLNRMVGMGLPQDDYKERLERLSEAHAARQAQHRVAEDQIHDDRRLQHARRLNNEVAWTQVVMDARLDATRDEAEQALKVLRDSRQRAVEEAAQAAAAAVRRQAEEEEAERARRQDEAEALARRATEQRATAERAAAAQRARQESEARDEAERLARRQAEAARQQAERSRLDEGSAWRRTELVDRAEGYRQFLKAWPDGPHAAAASARIEALDAPPPRQPRIALPPRKADLPADPGGARHRSLITPLPAAGLVVLVLAAGGAWWLSRDRTEPTPSVASTAAAAQEVVSGALLVPAPAPASLAGVAASADAAKKAAVRYRKLEALLQVAGCSACGEMSVIEAGEFEMGSPASEPQRDKDEGPVRKVKVGRFEIGRTAVTQGQWTAVMGSNPSFFSSCGDACPIENVSWNDITGPGGFLAKLKEKTGVSYRLASEAEREFATRAGTTTAYWWGNAITPGQANYDGKYVYAGGGGKGEYREKTVRADAFEPNPWGLYNVHGNVWEWMQDCWQDSYRGAPETGVAESDCWDTRRVVRGGSWRSDPRILRSAFRDRFLPDLRSYGIGLRLARSL